MVLVMMIASLMSWEDDRPERLPGSELSVVQANRQALYVIEAGILRLGERRPDRSRDGGLVYPRALVKPFKAVKGARFWGESPQQVRLLLTQNDTVPKEGEVYVLYIQGMNRGLYAFKVTRPDGAMPVHEVGNGIGLAEAERAARYVIEAKVQDLGKMEWDPDRPPRGLIYPRVVVEPSSVIKGADKAAALAIRHVRLPFARDEASPEKGRAYVFYLRQSARGLEVFRVTKRSEITPVRLPGSEMSTSEADSKALYVIEARILRLGELQEDRSRPHGLVYPQVVIEQSKVVKESHEGAARPGRDVRLLLTEDEAIPNEGETYTLYVRGRDRGFEVFKVTRPSEVNRR